MSLALRTTREVGDENTFVDGSESAGDEGVTYDDGLLATVGPIMFVCYSLFFTIAAVTFMGSGTALYAVVISFGFAVIFFAIPILFLTIRASKDARWRKDAGAVASPIVEIWTGSIHRWEAIVQMVSIPLAILLGFTLLAIRWSTL